MISFLVYTQDGEICRTGACPAEMLDIQAQDGEATLECDPLAKDSEHYVLNGTVQAYTAVELAEKNSLSVGWIWKMPERKAVDARPLTLAISQTLSDVDRSADTARLLVVGDPVRVKEYERAEQQARAFRNDGYIGDVPASVECWAAAKGWSAQHAADDILAASVRWYAALDGIRALRLAAKEGIRNATTNSAADAILANFSAALTTAMQGVT